MYIFTSDYIQYIHVKHVKHGVPVGPHVFYMFYMNILYVIGCTHFYEEEYMDPTCVFNFFYVF